MVVSLVAAFVPSLLASNITLAVAALVVAGVFAVVRARPKPVNQEYEAGFFVEVSVGNILDEQAIIAIGMCDTFDVDPPHIAPSSLQGQFLVRTWNGDSAGLKAALQVGLGDVSLPADALKEDSRAVYPIGTVAPVSREGRLYLCVAYSSMDPNSNARASLAGMTQSLYSLWDAVNRHSNGAEVAVPLVGQGQSRLNALPPEAALRLIAMTYVLRSNSERVGRGLKIVLLPSDARRVDLREFARYLRTLPGACR